MLELHIGGHEDCFLVVIGIVADAPAFYILQLQHVGQLLAVDAVGIVDHAV